MVDDLTARAASSKESSHAAHMLVQQVTIVSLYGCLSGEQVASGAPATDDWKPAPHKTCFDFTLRFDNHYVLLPHDELRSERI